MSLSCEVSNLYKCKFRAQWSLRRCALNRKCHQMPIFAGRRLEKSISGPNPPNGVILVAGNFC